MKPMLATLAERVPTGPEWVRSRAGRDASRRRACRSGDSACPQRQRRRRVIPSSVGWVRTTTTCFRRRGGGPRWWTAGFCRARGSHARQGLPQGRATGDGAPGDVHGRLRPVAPFARTSPAVPWTARARCSRNSTSTRGTGRCPVSTTARSCSRLPRTRGLEGIVSKRRTATYAAGAARPTGARRHIARPRRSSSAGGGRRPGRPRLGSVLVRHPLMVTGAGGGAGRVGSGLVGGAGKRLSEILEPLRASAPLPMRCRVRTRSAPRGCVRGSWSR